MKIAIFTNICIDENKTEKSEYRGIGSPGLFLQAILKKFPEVESKIFSSTGKDFEEFRGILDVYPEEPQYEKTLLNINHIVAKNRIRGSKNRDIAPPIIDDYIKKYLNESDIVILAPLLPNFSKEYVAEIFKHTKDDVIAVTAPQGYYRNFDENDIQIFRKFEEYEDILPFFDYSIVALDDHPNIEKDVKNWVTKTKVNGIITMAEDGAKLVTRETETTVPVENPLSLDEIVDSVGIGENFTAGFVYGLKKYNDPISAIEFANKVAGRCLLVNALELKEGKIDFSDII